ncbi:hypothetical protein MOKP120_47030 [Mycobacterium avium subsp. hominissuis]
MVVTLVGFLFAVNFVLAVLTPEEFFGVVEGVGAGLVSVQVGWWEPLGFAFGVFVGGPGAGL